MNPLLKKLAIVLAVGTGGLTAPLVPQDMTFVEAYQYPVAAYQAEISPILMSSSSEEVVRPAVKNPQPEYTDDNGDGLISVAVFRDKKENLIFYQIPEDTYKSMGYRNGSVSNPKKEEFLSVIDLLTPTIAKGAISIDASASTALATSATSKTLPFTTSSGANTILVISALNFGDVEFNSVAFNGASTTLYIQYDDYYREGIFYLKTPDVGTYNIVVTFSATAYSAISAVSLFGVDQTTPVNTYGTDGFLNDWTDRGTTLTTTVDGCGVFTTGGVDNGGFVAGDANATVVTSGYGNYVAQQWGIVRSTTFPQTSAGLITVVYDGSTGGWGRSMSIAFAPATEAPPASTDSGVLIFE